MSVYVCVCKSVDILALSSVQELHASPRLFVALFLLFSLSLYRKGVLYVFVLRYRNKTVRTNRKKVYVEKSNWTNKKSLKRIRKRKKDERNNEWLMMLYTGESKKGRKGNQLLYTQHPQKV
jgi:hypothetical protein